MSSDEDYKVTWRMPGAPEPKVARELLMNFVRALARSDAKRVELARSEVEVSENRSSSTQASNLTGGKNLNDAPRRDLLMGAQAIADYLGVTRRQVYRLVADDIIPSFKLGGTVAARRSSLIRWMDSLERCPLSSGLETESARMRRGEM